MTATLKVTHKGMSAEVLRVRRHSARRSFEMKDTIEILSRLDVAPLQIHGGRQASPAQTLEAAESQTVAFRCTGKSFLPIFLASFFVPSLALQLRREADDRSL